MGDPTQVDSATRLLLVEDDADLTAVLSIGLRKEGFIVDVVHNGIEAEGRILGNDYHILIVDWMIPGQDGPTLISRLRAAGVKLPTLMLTALSDTDHLVLGLAAGADDYLTKPFAFRELVARLRALGRRGGAGDGLIIERGPLRFNLRKKSVAVNGDTLTLRSKEYEILEMLALAEGSAVTRAEIAVAIWEQSLEGIGETTINMTISTLRKKLRDSSAGLVAIETVRGVGYRLQVRVAESSPA
jgi:DNA-binding response OmpR family regulator